MKQLLSAIGKGSLNIFLSIIIGGIAVTYCNSYYPEVMDTIQYASSIIKSILGFVGLMPSQPNTLQILLFDDNQFAFLFFMLAARILLAIISTIYSLIFGEEQIPYRSPNDARGHGSYRPNPPPNQGNYRNPGYTQPPNRNRYQNNYTPR